MNKTLKKTLSIILSILMIVTSVPFAFAADTPITRVVDGATYYELDSAEDLYWFANQVNGGQQSINAILVDDIDLENQFWEPLKIYYGIFDGNGHTISNIYFFNSSNAYLNIGFIGENGGIVKNLGLVNVDYSSANIQAHTGGICAENDNLIENCYVTGSVDGYKYVGGIAAYNYGRIVKCYNEATVSGSDYVGGIAGTNGPNGTPLIIECYNKGAVNGTMYVGGISGYSIGNIITSYNHAYIDGTQYTGGICGSNRQNVKDCYSTGDVDGIVNVSGGPTTGAIVGYNTGTVNNCFFASDVCSWSAVCKNDSGGTATGVYGRTFAQFQNGTVAAELIGTYGQNIDNGEENQGYPVIGGANVYISSPCYAVASNTPKTIEHIISDGTCIACGYTEAPVVLTEENISQYGFDDAYLGYYVISTAGQLYKFAELANNDLSISGVLIDNITVNKNVLDENGELAVDASELKEWTVIGESYKGTFDGNGYYISGLYKTGDTAGGMFYSNVGTIKNLTIIDSYFLPLKYYNVGSICSVNYNIISNCYNYSTVYSNEISTGAGGICGTNYGLIEKCANYGNVTSLQYDAGGIATTTAAGYSSGAGGIGNIFDCYNAGSVSAPTGDAGGIAGKIYYREKEVSNCYNIGNVSGANPAAIVAYNGGGIVTNCYYDKEKSGVDTAISINEKGTEIVKDVREKTTAEFASGEIAYLLNGDQTNIIWGQDIGKDETPVLNGRIVYRGFDKCKPIYSNTVQAVTEQSPHEMENGTCTYCGKTCGVGFDHDWSDKDGICNICGIVCGTDFAHVWKEGICTTCGYECVHNWVDGICSVCTLVCIHTFENSECTVCGEVCGTDFEHSWNEGVCTTCGYECIHNWEDGLCSVCTLVCIHAFENSECTVCGEVCGTDFEHKWRNGTCASCGYVCLHSDSIIDWTQTKAPTCTEAGSKTGICVCGLKSDTYESVVCDSENYPESEHNYISRTDEEYEFSYEDASELILKFSERTETEAKYDFIYIYDWDGNQYGKYSGTELAGAEIILPGNSFTIRLTSDSVGVRYGFSFDSITANVYEPYCFTTEIKPIGHNFENGTCINCYETCTHESYTDSKCDACGYVCLHENYTDGVCDNCEYACTHEWGEGVLTRPTFETAGYYTYTCTLCGHSYTEPTKRADDTALNDASIKVMEYIGNDTLTQEALNEIHNSYLDILKNNGNVFDEFGFVRNDLVEEDQTAINAVTAELEKIVADAEEKIASGEYVKIDGMKEYNKIADALDAELMENYSQEEIAALAEKAGDEINARFGEIIEKAEALTGTVAENKDALAEIESEMRALYGEIKNCLDGVHNGLVYEVTEEAKCGVNAIESATCTLCGETDEREIEGTALSHSFTKYEVTEEAECGKAGKEVAYCDHGCGATDENEIPALKHNFVNYVYNNDATCEADGTKTAKCANGCGATNKIKAEGTKLDHVDGDGDYICDYGCGHIFEQPDTPDDPADDTCHMCGGKVHGNDIMSRISCFFAMIIRFVTEILTSVKK